MEKSNATENDFWMQRVKFFAVQFPSYYKIPQTVFGRFHVSEERYFHGSTEIIPLSAKTGSRTYVMMQPLVFEPILTLTIGLYNKPKHYADQESATGETLGAPQMEGVREQQIGNAQAWSYPADKTIVLWECFFDRGFRRHPLKTYASRQKLWRSFEQWLTATFPTAKTIVTPFNDPIARSFEEYQAFLTAMSYKPIAPAAFGKTAGNASE